ncbi:hypothetical protein [Amycolatopsis sp. NPDC004378]
MNGFPAQPEGPTAAPRAAAFRTLRGIIDELAELNYPGGEFEYQIDALAEAFAAYRQYSGDHTT